MTKKTTPADRLRYCIEKLNTSQVIAAKVIGVNRRTMTRWVNGEMPVPPHITFLFEVLVKFGITLDQVAELSAERSKP